MNSTDFNQLFFKSVEKMLRKKYPNYKIITDDAFEILKVGISCSGVVVHMETLTDLYNEYINNDYTMDYLVNLFIERNIYMNKAAQELAPILRDEQYILDNVFFSIVNADFYGPYLRDTFYLTEEDLIAICMIPVSNNNLIKSTTKAGIVLSRKFTDKYVGLSDFEIFSSAIKNTPIAHEIYVGKSRNKLIPDSIMEISGSITGSCGVPFFCKQFLRELSIKLKGDLILIPITSTSLLVTTKNTQYSLLDIYESFFLMNYSLGHISKPISNHIYSYNRKTDKISIIHSVEVDFAKKIEQLIKDKDKE